MSLDVNSGSFISLTEAQEYVQSFRAKYPMFPKGFFAGKDKIRTILAQPDCIGIRTYYGFDEKNKVFNLVMVGVDSDERDMTGEILERLIPCPGECDTNSPLY